MLTTAIDELNNYKEGEHGVFLLSTTILKEYPLTLVIGRPIYQCEGPHYRNRQLSLRRNRCEQLLSSLVHPLPR
jgi:hypothetical protein